MSDDWPYQVETSGSLFVVRNMQTFHLVRMFAGDLYADTLSDAQVMADGLNRAAKAPKVLPYCFRCAALTSDCEHQTEDAV